MTPKCVVLLFAYHYPPENAIGGVRPFRFCKYLPENGFEVHVVTAAQQHAGSPSPNVTYVPDPYLQRQVWRVSWQAERALRKLLLPGVAGTGWAFRAAAAGRRIIRAHPDARFVVLSTFPPLGSQLAGWLLTHREHVPWVADLRDPFPEANTRRARTFWRWLQRTCFARASLVIANTDAAQSALQASNPVQAGKVRLLPNGFDPSSPVKPLPLPSRSDTVLSHIGELYAGRTVAPILESLDRLIAGNGLSGTTTSVRLVGPAENSCLPSRALLDKAERDGWLHFRPEQIPKEEAQQLARTSDRLLLLQPHTAVQIPAKLFEYIQIGRPILAFLQRNSPSERILEGSGIPYQVIYGDMQPSQMDAIILEFLTTPIRTASPSAWFDEVFNVQNQVRMLASWLHNLLNKHA